MKELSSEREDFGVMDQSRGVSTLAPPAMGSGVDECRMELDGARVRYLRAGSGPALILLHGLLGYSFSWRFTIPALARYATVYAPDMLGAGFSDRPAGLDHSMGATSKRLLQFLEKLGLSSFDLLGTSHGGAVAMMTAAECLGSEARLHVGRLILVSPVNPYSAHGRCMAPFFASRFGAALFRLTVARMNFLFRYGHRRLYADRSNIPPGTLDGYMAPLAMPGLFEHGLSIVRTWTQDLQELEATLPKLKNIPTLLMWGSRDSAVYASSAGPLAKHFSNSQVIIFPRVGHLPYEECAEEFNRALIQFLTSDSPSPVEGEAHK
jgi:pimeloyl-ACP methyl ester carboxylesterase